MPSPAERQAEAVADVRRVAEALKDALDKDGVELTSVMCERAIARLVIAGLIEPVKRPRPEPPMSGQTTIEEQLDAQ